MPAIRLTPQSRFLLLGSLLVAGLSLLWWLALMNPALLLLREAVGACGAAVSTEHSALRVTESAIGGWTFEVPLEASLPQSPGHPKPRRIRSIHFGIKRSSVGAFTFGLPVYWALILASPGIRRCWLPLVAGTVAVTALEIVLLLVNAEILARSSLLELFQLQDPVEIWFLRFSDYLMVTCRCVLPFAVALWLDRELREQIFHWAGAAAVPARSAAIPEAPRRVKRFMQKRGRRE